MKRVSYLRDASPYAVTQEVLAQAPILSAGQFGGDQPPCTEVEVPE